MTPRRKTLRHTVRDERLLVRLAQTARSAAVRDAAAGRLARASWHQVLAVAHRWSLATGCHRDELESAGFEGLAKAIGRYDLAHPKLARFNSYATWWIRSAIRTEAARRGPVAVPINARTNPNGYTPLRDHAIAAAVADANREVVSLSEHDTLTGVRRQDYYLVDFGDGGLPAEATADALLARMPARLEYVLRQRAIGATLKEIGRELGITRERVRQIQRQAAGCLRGLWLMECGRSLASAAAAVELPSETLRRWWTEGPAEPRMTDRRTVVRRRTLRTPGTAKPIGPWQRVDGRWTLVLE